MGKAGQFALNNAARDGAVSFSTAATNGERWGEFAKFAKNKMSVRYMEQIEPETVIAYGRSLQEKVTSGEMSAATAQNYVSTVNSVMSLATEGKWDSISPTRNCGIDQRSGIASTNRSISQSEHDRLTDVLSARLSAMLDVERSLGLRFEECAKLNSVVSLAEAKKTGQVTITFGTKGGLERTVLASPESISALEKAAAIQGVDRSMIPSSDTYRGFQQAAYRELKKIGGKGFHGERHWFAQQRYTELVGAPAPIVKGWRREERFERLAEHLGVSEQEARTIDNEARQKIAEELGHGRAEVTNAYLG